MSDHETRVRGLHEVGCDIASYSRTLSVDEAVAVADGFNSEVRAAMRQAKTKPIDQFDMGLMALKLQLASTALQHAAQTVAHGGPRLDLGEVHATTPPSGDFVLDVKTFLAQVAPKFLDALLGGIECTCGKHHGQE